MASAVRAITLCVSLMCFVSAGVGCVQFSAKQKCEQLGEQFNTSYRLYLYGDAATGVREMERMAKVLQDAGNWFSLSSRAHGLAMVHARLYCLYEDMGCGDLAAIQFQKCLYWQMMRAEAAGRLPKEIAESIVGYSMEKCRRDVVEWDNGRRRENERSIAAKTRGDRHSNRD